MDLLALDAVECRRDVAWCQFSQGSRVVVAGLSNTVGLMLACLPPTIVIEVYVNITIVEEP